MLRHHLDSCPLIPCELRAKIEELKMSLTNRIGVKQNWINSAKRLGLVDTPRGIRFCRNPNLPIPFDPLFDFNKGDSLTPPIDQNNFQVDSLQLLSPEDKSLISGNLYLILQQLEPCILMKVRN